MGTPLIKEFYYDAPIEKVWRALTDKDKIKKWYFPQLQQFDPVFGFTFQFDDGAEYQKEWIVTNVLEGKTLAHSWAYKGYPRSSEVIFDLFSEGYKTRLKVMQTDLDSFPTHPHFTRDRFDRGWDNLLGHNLKHLLEVSNNS
ncbi:SRPBCC domain-containing protein [Spirosoma sp. KNUC1025]|uniref:SRPBCC family protein n=1 Tax=Spirosoma sp. KNUC1025 TaxID=2894082 RepID=UPI003867771E|nr:SRPBCC domain-containing protein [Spirosoma sp. KNUC1025]